VISVGGHCLVLYFGKGEHALFSCCNNCLRVDPGHIDTGHPVAICGMMSFSIGHIN
jgi:hypothetical protein